MALLERVATLVRANLNDLIDKAENPEKMIKQLILDMQNQLLQVKTQVAIAIADQHLLMRKQKENEQAAEEWIRKAELAVDKKQDDLARAALERSMTARQVAESFTEQVADQTAQVENLKTALRKLEAKLVETQNRSDVLVAQHRRARALVNAGDARMKIGDGSRAAAVRSSEAEGPACRSGRASEERYGVGQYGRSPGRARERGCGGQAAGGDQVAQGCEPVVGPGLRSNPPPQYV
jgi:phage shock protein A